MKPSNLHQSESSPRDDPARSPQHRPYPHRTAYPNLAAPDWASNPASSPPRSLPCPCPPPSTSLYIQLEQSPVVLPPLNNPSDRASDSYDKDSPRKKRRLTESPTPVGTPSTKKCIETLERHQKSLRKSNRKEQFFERRQASSGASEPVRSRKSLKSAPLEPAVVSPSDFSISPSFKFTSPSFSVFSSPSSTSTLSSFSLPQSSSVWSQPSDRDQDPKKKRACFETRDLSGQIKKVGLAGGRHQTVCRVCGRSNFCGTLLRCSVCPNYDLCEICFASSYHHQVHHMYPVHPASEKELHMKSCSHGVMRLLSDLLLRQIPSLSTSISFFLCNFCDHYAVSCHDKGTSIPIAPNPGVSRDVSTTSVPTLLQLQQWIEASWEIGREANFFSKNKSLVGTRTSIGWIEIAAFLRYLGYDCRTARFEASGRQPPHRLFEFLSYYFLSSSSGGSTKRVVSCPIAPVLLFNCQKEGVPYRSRVVVGVELCSSECINLIVLDPLHTPEQMKAALCHPNQDSDSVTTGRKWRLLRRSVHMRCPLIVTVVIQGRLCTV